MSYGIQLSRLARRFLDKLEDTIADQIIERIERLKTDPRPVGCKKLTDTRPVSWRIRVGNYRVIYRIDDLLKVVVIVTVDLRAKAYKKR